MVIRATATLVAQTSLIAAILLFFGWTRDRAAAAYLGFPETSLGTTPQRYVMDGVLALFDPLLVAAVIALLWRIADPFVVRLLRGPARARRRRRTCRTMTVVVVLLCPLAWLLTGATAFWPEPAASFSASTAALLAAYTASLWGRTGAAGTLGDVLGIIRPYVLLLFTMLLFWATGTFATAEGQGAARVWTSTLDRQLAVVAYSTGDLRLQAPGVLTAPLLGSGRYHFRYSGLRMYSYSDGHLFLVPTGWTYERPQVIVLTDDASIRVEYVG